MSKGPINLFKELLGDRCVDSASELLVYGQDYSYHTDVKPDVVVFPKTEQEIVKIVQICSRFKLPIIPYGSGTSLEGHISPIHGGVCLSFRDMAEIIQINKSDMDVVVQPGLSFMKLNSELEKLGLYFPLDAGPNASIGGMVATSASGTKAVRYGTMKDNVLSLRVVLPNGSIIKTSNRAPKSVSGYDLTHLFTASEGTLGLITLITLKIYHLPPNRCSALIPFKTIEDSTECVYELSQLDIQLGMVELMDDLMMRAINLKNNLIYPEQPTLYLEFSGDALQIQTQLKTVQNICSKYNAGPFHFAETKEERERLFSVRKSALFASTALKPGASVWTTDVCVPKSKLAQCISLTKVDLKNSIIIAPLVGHVGDGNFHLFMLVDTKDKKEMEDAKRINHRLILRALEMEGTCTGEHGVGIGKKEYLENELGKDTVQLMRKIKKIIDPSNIMNPGKKIDMDVGELFSEECSQDINIKSYIDKGKVNINIYWGNKLSKL